MKQQTSACVAFVALALLLGSARVLAAQGDPSHQSIAELELTELLNARATTGARHDQRLIDSPQQLVVVTADDIRRKNYRNTPHALSDVLGVFLDDYITKPIQGEHA